MLQTAAAAVYKVGPQRQYTQIGDVLGLLRPGDVVEVDGGWSYPGGFTLKKSGTPKAKVTLRGMRVRGQLPKIVGVNGIKGAAVACLRGNHCVMEGFDISAAGDPLASRALYIAADDVVVRGCVVHDSPVTGIASSDSSGSLRLEQVEVHHCGQGDRQHQIYVGSDNTAYPKAVFHMEFCHVHDGTGGNNVKSRAGRTELHYNWIEGAFFHELDLIGADPKGQAPGAAGAVREDSEVLGNVIVHPETGRGSLANLGSDGTGNSNGRYRFVGNTIVMSVGGRPGKELFRLRGQIESCEVANNLFMGGGFCIGFPQGIRTSGENNWLPSNTRGIPTQWSNTLLGQDPKVGRQGSLAYIPLKGSPLIGAASYPTKPVPGYEFPNPTGRPVFLPCVAGTDMDRQVVRVGVGEIGAFEVQQ